MQTGSSVTLIGGNLEKLLLFLYGTEWRERGCGLCGFWQNQPLRLVGIWQHCALFAFGEIMAG
jgi:hypothetical protein